MTPEDCRKLRASLGLTQDKLATLSGLAERTIQLFEAERVQPRPGTLIALRKAFRKAQADSPAMA